MSQKNQVRSISFDKVESTHCSTHLPSYEIKNAFAKLKENSVSGKLACLTWLADSKLRKKKVRA